MHCYNHENLTNESKGSLKRKCFLFGEEWSKPFQPKEVFFFFNGPTRKIIQCFIQQNNHLEPMSFHVYRESFLCMYVRTFLLYIYIHQAKDVLGTSPLWRCWSWRGLYRDTQWMVLGANWYCTVFVISIFFPWLCSSKLFFFYGDVEGFSKYLYIYFINVRVKEV